MLNSILTKNRPDRLLTKLVARGTHFFRTGYWHTGERCCADFPDENFANHFKVYRFVSQFCAAKDVLDIGCGTGYGTSFLASSARSVVGIDISRQAVRYAKRRYKDPRVRFMQMDAECLRFTVRSFDFIISTENFEHLRDQRANLREISRVLRDEGVLFLATPNYEMFTSVTNKYHTHECSYEELNLMMGEYFSEHVVVENLLTPPTEEGRRLKEARERRNASGISLATNSILWGQPVDPAWLSNTHSFFCFARSPRRDS